MKYFLTACLTLILFHLHGQDSGQDIRQTAQAFTRQGDYGNALVVLQRGLQLDPDNLTLVRELAFVYYLKQDYDRALAAIRPATERRDADVATFQVAAMVYKARDDAREAENVYKRGLRKFPNSGVLYSEYGELLWFQRDYTAIRQWEKGIEADPNYPGNYYHAARHYYFTMDKVWGLIYGEIFVNMESYSRRTVEIKTLLLDGYKKLFAGGDPLEGMNAGNEFVQAYLRTMRRQVSLTGSGISPEALIMIRTRFMLDWDKQYASKFPFRLFDYHRQLLREGLFEAYNQWLFGAVQNLTAFQSWTNTHADTYRKFLAFQQGRVFKMSAGTTME